MRACESTPTVLTVSVDTWHDKSCVLLLLLLLLLLMHKNIESEARAVTKWPNNNHSLKAVLK